MLHFDTPAGEIRFEPRAAVVAGWTGRDAAAVRHHVEELAAIGVARPSEVPLYYRVWHGLLTQDGAIEALGAASSGEAEPVLLETGRGTFLTLGSDHTDRELEAHSVAASKQACAKPLASQAWPWDDVVDRLDDLVLRSSVSEDGDTWEPYQDGTLAAMRPLTELRDGAAARLPGGFAPGTAMFCGTLPALDGVITSAPHFACELHDPALGRTLALRYVVRALPAVS